MHWYPCIPVSGVSNAEHDSQCIPLLLFPDLRHVESIREDLRDRYQTEPDIFLNQFVKCRSVTGQALLFFHCFGCILSKYGTG